jgi:hypothetical protein
MHHIAMRDISFAIAPCDNASVSRLSSTVDRTLLEYQRHVFKCQGGWKSVHPFLTIERK